MSYFFGAAGVLFFGCIALYIFSSLQPVSNQSTTNTDHIVFYSILGIFIFFSVWSLIIILKLKIVILTHQELIIQHPLLFLKKIIPLHKISNIEEKEFNINPKIKRKTYEIHKGNQCIINLNNKQQIILNSFEILEYEDLMKKLFIANNQSVNNNYEIKNEGYVVLIMISLLIVVLVIFTIFR
ncbi:hypothetical protein CLU96_4221 [Chryseobacterium sp. 52]|nr:hypothetical protein CLU96_4221 [Chryseobacterium sp. 52]